MKKVIRAASSKTEISCTRSLLDNLRELRKSLDRMYSEEGQMYDELGMDQLEGAVKDAMSVLLSHEMKESMRRRHE